MSNQLPDVDGECLELSSIKSQSSSSKQPIVSQNLIRKQWKNHFRSSIRRRQSLLNKVLVGVGESLINVHGYNHNLKEAENKVDDIIRINVSGNIYETRLSTIENYPNTLLGNKDKRKCYWNKKTNEYFFDRHRLSFEGILYYYQSNGRLRRPDSVPLDTFLEEISFFQLGEEALEQINQFENVSIIKYIDLPNSYWRRYIWFYLEYPQHSIFARILYTISLILTLLISITLTIETLPQYKQTTNSLCLNQSENLTTSTNNFFLCQSIFSSPFFIIQTVCVVFFTIEFLLRLLSTPSYWKFVLTLSNWIDLATILPYFIFIGLILNNKQTDLDGRSFVILRMLRLLRFLRIFKISIVFKQFKSLRVLASTLKESFTEFFIMVIVLTLFAFIFGAGIYFAEQETNGEVFDSILKSTYWGIMTISTVGYGDMYPITVVGRILACACALLGVATSGMLVSVLVDRYQRIYNRKRYLPEQVLSAADSSGNENNDKQDFINRKLSRTKKSMLNGSNLPRKSEESTSTKLDINKNNRKKYSKSNHLPSSSPSYVRFILTIVDDQTNDLTNQLMNQLTDIIQITGDPIRLKLINTQTDSPKDKYGTKNNQLTVISEE